MEKGKIILLNGTSSAGKSTTAKAVQAVMAETYLHLGVDHFQQAFPSGLIGIGTKLTGELVGWQVRYSDNGLQEVRIGPLGYRLGAAMYRAVAGVSDAGINVVMDDVIWTRQMLATAVKILHTYPVYFIALDLSLAAAEQRERARGDRGPGNAQYFYPLVYELNDIYDARIDVEKHDLETSAQLIKTAVATIQPTAFKKLAQQFSDYQLS